MNILILSWRGPGHPQSGGAEQVTLQHGSGWVKAGHKVTLLTAAFGGSKPRETIQGVEIIRQGDQFIGVRLAAFFWYWFGNHSQVDLVVDEFHGIPFFTPIWALKSKKLGFIHEVAQPVWALNTWPKPFNIIPAIVGKHGEPWMFRLLYTNIPFMTVSNSTKEDLQKFGVKNITVVPNGVILPKNLPKVKKEKDFTIIYLSALAKDKGIEDAIKAFNLVNKEIPEAKFWIVGKGDPTYVNYLKSLIINPESCIFYGFVLEELKFKLLAKAHVLLFPSVHEGWGLVIIEAASVGTPTVAYDVGGVRDAVKDGVTGFLSKIKNAEDLVKLLLKFHSNSGLYRNLSENSVKWGKSFLWRFSIIKSTNRIFHEQNKA